MELVRREVRDEQKQNDDCVLTSFHRHYLRMIRPLFTGILSSTVRWSQPAAWVVSQGWYLPAMAHFCSPIHDVPAGEQRQYCKAQEATRKDTERCFGVMKGRFHVIRKESEI